MLGPSPRDLGELIRSLRLARGLKMPRVMELLSEVRKRRNPNAKPVPRSTAWWWEGPRSRPEPEDLQDLLDLYGATDAERLKAWELRTSNPLEVAPTEPLDPPTVP
jgi:transcriptional regulator with XRE-family HTH domain